MATKTSAKPGTASIVREYFEAIDAHEMDRAVSLWKPGSIDDLVGIAKLVAPQDIKAYFEELFRAAPDFSLKVLSQTTEDDCSVVHWQMTATFTGTGKALGLAANGSALDVTGIDLLTVEDDKIVSNTAITNGLEIARQMGVLPPADSALEKAMFAPFNALAPLLKRRRAGE